MTISELANMVAQQAQRVEALGMGNVAQMSSADAMNARAQYELAAARLTMLREDLVTKLRAEKEVELIGFVAYSPGEVPIACDHPLATFMDGCTPQPTTW